MVSAPLRVGGRSVANYRQAAIGRPWRASGPECPLLVVSCRTRSGFPNRLYDMECVDILLEGDHLTMLQRPNMDRLRVHAPAGRFRGTPIPTQGYHAITAIDQIFHRNGKSVPLADTASEYALRYCFRPR